MKRLVFVATTVLLLGLGLLVLILVAHNNARAAIIPGNNTKPTPQQCAKASHILQSLVSNKTYTATLGLLTSALLNYAENETHKVCGNVTAAGAAPLANAQNQNLTENNLTKTFGNKTDTFNTDANHIREASAQLHNDNVTYGKLVSEDSLLLCIDQVFFHSKAYLNATDLDKYNCDTDTVDDIKEHTFADNQTMLHLAYAYLNARGIH